MNDGQESEYWLYQRQRMVDQQIRGRGIRDERVLQAMLAVPRERFVPIEVREAAYEDRALAVGFSQTISQPFIVAYMTELLSPALTSSVLEIGTGTGYQTAILTLLSKHVFSIERIDELRRTAEVHLAALQITNATLYTGDGSAGLPANAPYDRIIVTAGAPRVPKVLVEQLADGGRLVIPVGTATEQNLVRVDRDGSRTVETTLLACRFVKLIGQEGWAVEHQMK